MRFVILGAGTIGSAVAWDLLRDADVTSVGLVGNQVECLEQTRLRLNDSRVRCHQASQIPQQAVAILKQYDVAVLALPDRRADYFWVERVLEAGIHGVDVIEDYHRHPEPHETEQLQIPHGFTLDEFGEHLHRHALNQGVLLLDGIGFAPGLSNLTVGHALHQLDEPDSAIARVGGIPSKEAAAHHPLGYMITWDFAHVLREYMVRLRVIENGRFTEVSAGSDVQPVRFNRLGRDEILEGANTAGMPSFLHTRPHLREFAEKTLRWPGHWQAIRTLRECGLLDLEPVSFAGTSIVPREFLAAVLTPRLQRRPGESDVCVMLNTVTGTRAGIPLTIEQYLWEEADPVTGLTAMQRTTAFPAAIAARMVAQGKITCRGIVPSEDAVFGSLYTEFLEELAARGIRIEEVHTTGNRGLS